MHSDRRRDRARAEIINNGIAMDVQEGAIRAWIYMTNHGISPNTIQRVLALDGVPSTRRRPPLQSHDVGLLPAARPTR
jgi:hypothetical protein